MPDFNPFEIDVAETIGGDVAPPVAPEEAQPPEPPPPPLTDEEIVQILLGYNQEAENARKSGHAPRDLVWEQNWMIFWNLFDDSQKADWQSRDVMPEAPQFVERWASSMREALVASGADYYSVTDVAHKYGGLSKEVKVILDYYLDRAGETEEGHPVGFPVIFEDLLKSAALMALCLAVTWKRRKETRVEAVLGANGQAELVQREVERGYVAIEAVDPRTVWYDPSGRRLYRRRRITMELHDLVEMGEKVDSQGRALFNREAIQKIQDAHNTGEREREKETSSGTSEQVSALGRKPVVVDEYLCALVKPDGTLAWPRNTYVMMANEREIIRGPEPNPNWHARDWIIFTPLSTVPFSVYGKSYVENWAHVARTFNEMTRAILDATISSSLNAFVMDADKLANPGEIAEGIHPNKVFEAEAGADVTKVVHEIELGKLPPESIQVWQGIKQELREGAQLSEIALGQLPPKGDITATEITESKSSSSSVVRSVASTLEQRGLDLTFELVWYTAMQHMDMAQEPNLVKALGELGALLARLSVEQRYRLLGAPYQFKVRGISSLLDRARDRNALLSALQIIASDPILKQAFLARYDEQKVVDRVFRLSGVDTTGLEREEGAPVPQVPQEQQPGARQALPTGGV